MKISINGQQTILMAQQNVLENCLPEFDAERPYAVAVNGNFVARADYDKVILQEGDQVDIVSPVGGG